MRRLYLYLIGFLVKTMAKKTSVRITGVGQARDNLLRALLNNVKDPELLNQLGNLAAEQIVARVRGRADAEYKQPEIKDVTVEARKLYNKHYQTDPLYSPKRSNLTLSGQLLKSIKHRINTALREITLYIDPKRSQYFDKSLAQKEYDTILDKDRNATNKNAKGKNKLKASAAALLLKSENKNNVQIKEDLEEKGRKFFFISEKLNKRLTEELTRYIRTKLSAFRKQRRVLK